MPFVTLLDLPHVLGKIKKNSNVWVRYQCPSQRGHRHRSLLWILVKGFLQHIWLRHTTDIIEAHYWFVCDVLNHEEWKPWHSDIQAYMLFSIFRLSDAFPTTPCCVHVSQRSHTSSWPSRLWTSWTGVWSNWRRWKHATPSARWHPTRYISEG